MRLRAQRVKMGGFTVSFSLCLVPVWLVRPMGAYSPIPDPSEAKITDPPEGERAEEG